jgi:thiol-disulfide isomerase/thioredoxin
MSLSRRRDVLRASLGAAALSAATLPRAWAQAKPAAPQYRRTQLDAKQPLPPLVGTDLNGKAWDLAQLKGRAVLINFWGVWCPPCLEEMPALQTAAEVADPQLQFLTVNVRDPMSRLRRYLQQSGLTLPVLPDPRGEIANVWSAKVFPSTWLIDRQGRGRWRIEGAVDWTGSEAQEWLQTLVRTG